jgi:hypothetical protein
MEKTRLLKEQPKNGLRASSKAIVTWVTLRAQGGHVHLVGYGGDYPLRTAWEELDRPCWTLLPTTSPSRGSNPAKAPGLTTWSDSLAWQGLTVHCKHDERGHSGTDWEILPHSPYSPDLSPSDYHLSLSLSPIICAEFPSTTTLSSKIGSTTSSQPKQRFCSSVGSETCPNVGSDEYWRRIHNWLIVWLFVRKINYLEALRNSTNLCTNPIVHQKSENENYYYLPEAILKTLCFSPSK